jgi:dephospho-CoA kinase
MRIVGLLGGVASGKSLVARQLAALGAGVLDADAAGHAALRLPAVEAAARQRWGGRVFGPDGRIDRARLAEVVFAPTAAAAAERAFLEQLTHPEIARLLARQTDQFAAEGKTVAVLDAPLLLEAGWQTLCQTLVFVDAPRERRLQRALGRGWTADDFADRERAQWPPEQKQARADWTIDNSGPAEDTERQVQWLWGLISE